jgi:hypothetical protein
MKNLISIILLVVINFGFGQKYPKSIVIENDTIICFTTAQSKQLAIWNEQRKQCQEFKNIKFKRNYQ